jgi:N6-L-threonylcarbamoyladenine synthase
MHARFGGVVPELASRDHVRRLVPLVESVAASAGMALRGIDAIAYTRGPGLAGALLVGAGLAHALGYALDRPVIGIHHLEGHLLSPLLATPAPTFPFVALLVSGGHSQFHDVRGVGDYRLLGETQDDAAGEAFDKTATLLGLPYPGGPALAKLAERGRAGIYVLPRPMIDAPGLDMSFSGLKTAVRTLVHKLAREGRFDDAARADVARAFEDAIVDVLAAKSLAALAGTGRSTLVVAGGVGANRRLRERLAGVVGARGGRVHYPDAAFCTDNGAMIALAGALKLGEATNAGGAFDVRPRWPLGAA